MLKDEFYIYCLPVSGGMLVSHLAFLQEVFEARKIVCGGKLKGKRSYAPDICFGSSGGNLAIYLALLGDWSTEGIRRNYINLDNKTFIESWTGNTIPGQVIGLLTGSFFKHGQGAPYDLKESGNRNKLKSVEIWTGTYDRNNRKAQYFCNLTESTSIINPNFFNMEDFLFDALPLKYVDGDVNKIMDIIVASSSLPVILPPKIIDGIEYSDGGMVSSSPLSVFANEIVRIIKNDPKASSGNVHSDLLTKNEEFHEKSDLTYCQEEKIFEIVEDRGRIKCIDVNRKTVTTLKMRLFYFTCYQPDYFREHVPLDEVSQIGEIIEQFTHTSYLSDRNHAINILYRVAKSKVMYGIFYDMNYNKLGNLLQKLNKYQHYVISLFPNETFRINLFDFDGNSIEEKVKECRNNYSVQFWYCLR